MDLELLKSSFLNFLYALWCFLNLPPPTDIQYDIGRYLAEEKLRRIIVEAFRGCGKSWITSAFVLWKLWNNPELRILVISAGQDRARAFSTFTLRLINEVDFLQHLRPNKDKGQRYSMEAFDVGPSSPDHSPSVKSVGIFGQITGTRADIIICDDGEIPKNSATEDLRERLLLAMSEFDSIIKPDTGRIIYLGTPQTEESVYEKKATSGYDRRIWPARYVDPSMYEKYSFQIAPMLVEAVANNPMLIGTSTEPRRFPEEELLTREAGMGRSQFNLQWMLDTTLSDSLRYPLRCKDLIVLEVSDKAPVSTSWCNDPDKMLRDIPNYGFRGDRFFRPLFIDEQWSEFSGTVMHIDPSGRGKDEVGYAITSVLLSNIYLRAAGGLAGGYDEETLRKLAQLAVDFRVKEIQLEDNFGDGMFTQIFRPVLQEVYTENNISTYPAITEVKHLTQKELRIIDTLEPVMNQHRLIVCPSVITQDIESVMNDESKLAYSLIYQLTHITKERGCLKHDDRLEAVSMAVAYWQSAMAKSNSEAVKQHNQKQLEQGLRDFVKNCMFVRDKPKPKRRSSYRHRR